MTEFYMPTTIVEGCGSSTRLPVLCKGKRVVVVTDVGLASSSIVANVVNALRLSGKNVFIYADVSPNPDEQMVLALTGFLRGRLALSGLNNASAHSAVDSTDELWVVAVGGGSAIDTAKAAVCLAVNTGSLAEYQWEGRQFECPPLPLVAVPTTAGTGSEVTGVTVVSSRNTKKGIKQPYVFPRYAVVDPQLMVGLPPLLTASTGMDALTHAIEAFVGKNRNPLVRSMAASAISLVCGSIECACADGSDVDARSAMAHGSLLAGIAMDQGGLGIVHSLSSALCGILHVPHGEGNALLLPYGMRYNIPYATHEMADVARLMGLDLSGMDDHAAAFAAVEYVEGLLQRIGLEPSIMRIKSEVRSRTDLAEFGRISASMVLMNNNPSKTDAAQCEALFRSI
jgi:alcohol dehydrogenase class IV